jgi:hypothetical protein
MGTTNGRGEGGVSLTSIWPSAPACSITENIKYMGGKGVGEGGCKDEKNTGDRSITKITNIELL